MIAVLTPAPYAPLLLQRPYSGLLHHGEHALAVPSRTAIGQSAMRPHSPTIV